MDAIDHKVLYHTSEIWLRLLNLAKCFDQILANNNENVTFVTRCER